MDMDIGQGSPAAEPRRTLRHADAVTEDDTWAVHAFLMPRLEAQEAAHAPGTEEHRTAGAFIQVLSTLILLLQADIRAPSRKAGRGGRRRTNRHPVRVWAPPTEAELRAREERRLERIRENWSMLCESLRPWRDCEGYDHARWHRVAFPDAAAEAEYERRVTELGLRRGGAPGDS
ncbi:hypothetical protein [Streptomyces xanthophaeus]